MELLPEIWMFVFALDAQSNEIDVWVEVRRQPEYDRASGRFPGFKKDELAAVGNDRHLPRSSKTFLALYRYVPPNTRNSM